MKTNHFWTHCSSVGTCSTAALKILTMYTFINWLILDTAFTYIEGNRRKNRHERKERGRKSTEWNPVTDWQCVVCTSSRSSNDASSLCRSRSPFRYLDRCSRIGIKRTAVRFIGNAWICSRYDRVRDCSASKDRPSRDSPQVSSKTVVFFATLRSLSTDPRSAAPCNSSIGLFLSVINERPWPTETHRGTGANRFEKRPSRLCDCHRGNCLYPSLCLEHRALEF